MNNTEAAISTPFIRLDSLLKFAGVCMSGGEAKTLIQNGEVLLNGAVCTERGKKIKPGDILAVLGQTVTVTEGE